MEKDVVRWSFCQDTVNVREERAERYVTFFVESDSENEKLTDSRSRKIETDVTYTFLQTCPDQIYTKLTSYRRRDRGRRIRVGRQDPYDNIYKEQRTSRLTTESKESKDIRNRCSNNCIQRRKGFVNIFVSSLWWSWKLKKLKNTKDSQEKNAANTKSFHILADNFL